MADQRERIVVGVDGSPHSSDALQWALQETTLRDADVEIVHAWSVPTLPMTAYGTSSVPMLPIEDIEDAARAVLTKAAAEAGGRAVRTCLQEGNATDVLLERADGASLLVVGSRGHGGFAALLLGSVSGSVARHAPCPVVVVPAVASLEGRIVVGVDGSAHAVTALRWALTEARRRRVGVEVLYAWQYPAAFLYETAVLGDLDLEPAAAAIVARVLSDVEAEAEGIDVTARTVGGHAVEALVGAADGASLVVVGARGHGAMSGLLLGSVSDGVVRHAPCPVAVIP